MRLSSSFAIALMLFFIGLFGSTVLLGQNRLEDFYTIRSQTSQGLTIDFVFDEINVSSSASATMFEIPGLAYNYVGGRPLLPVLTLPLTLPEGKVTATIQIENSQMYPGQFPPAFQDVPNNPAETRNAQEERLARENPPVPYKQGYPHQIYQLDELGLFRDYQVTALRIYPLQVTPEGTRFYKKFTVRIAFANQTAGAGQPMSAETRFLEKLVLNREQAHLAVPQPSPAPAGPLSAGQIDYERRVRIIVDEDGLYRVLGSDLQGLGIDLSQINPATLRLTNKGKNVAILVSGDQDNRLDPEDALEFWGERNQKTFLQDYPDQYADPFSDENVYWLQWGGGTGLRMVEENGSLITSRPGEFNPSLLYSRTVHVEKNDHFERLGDANEERLSYTRDLWFFDSGVRAVGKRQYPFQLIYPAETSTDPVYVTAMFAGKSFNAHNVMVWLNNGFVGASAEDWYSQDTSRISNRAGATLRTNDLHHGENVLEVQMPQLTGNEIDIVLLNWFEVTYNRLYRAYQNQIEFRRPSFIPYPQTDLFQFDIEGFSRPDIEVYKKGISKMVNFRIELETIGDSSSYKISLQDNVPTDDVEFIAITADQKKSPLRLERDEPFDPLATQRFLKDPNNAAEYLIITHTRFYNNALNYRDYRRNQGVSAEVVRVQDIYDEFNYGIKSPLAIQEFLRYAFFNWRRTPRLAYVLLIGDANLNYKSTNPVTLDFVPTFLYQTQKFGAAASDYPYSLVSGEDEIPDLFVGRIPAGTNTEVQNAVSKIIEYEQSAPASSWRNNALFISGNDRSTYELSGILITPRPAFRTQNTRVIQNLLPKHISAIRLNTIRDTSLPFDPNFGSSSDLERYFQDGLFLINFMGHGGGGIWADVDLMRIADVDNLRNQGMYPFVTSMTCFTGAFENPSQQGLAQKLLLAPERGAIGVLASSGLGYLHNDYAMLWNMGQFLFDKSLSIGEALTLGTILYLSNGRNYLSENGNQYYTPGFDDVKHEMVYQYNLIGDPYLKLQYTAADLEVAANTVTPQPGEDLEVTLNTTLSGANGYVELVDQDFNIVNSIPVFGVSQSKTVTLAIPEDFLEGTGLVRAYLSDASQDAAGNIAIGVNHAAVNNISYSPENPDVDDTVRVSLRVEDVHGIELVTLVRTDTALSVTAVADPSDTNRYVAAMPPTGRLQTVPYDVNVTNSIGNVSTVRGLSYVVSDIRPDVFLRQESLRFVGTKRTRLRVGVENGAGAGADNSIRVNVYFADGAVNFQNQQYFASGHLFLNASDSASLTVDFPLSLQQSAYEIFVRAEVDPAEDVADFRPGNNTISRELEPTIFNVTAAGSDTIRVHPRFSVYFPPGSISDSSAVRVQLQEMLPPDDQIGLIPVHLLNTAGYHALEVTLLNNAASFSGPFQLKMALDTTLWNPGAHRAEDVVLYEQIASSQPWTSTLLRADAAGAVISGELRKSARFAPFVNTDAKAPRIELTADGRPLQESGLVSTKPSLYVIVQDESGVDLQKEKISVTLDGAVLPESQIFIPDSVQKNNVLGITLYPELETGKHYLEVKVQDVNGNNSDKEFELVVADGFDIHVYGNYPNPFKDQTIFSYYVVLNDDLDELEIRIYTVSGRLVRRIDSDINNRINDPDGGARRQGYNELIWDGTDEKGYEVANGVYFAVIRGSYEGETIEKILKVAKLK